MQEHRGSLRDCDGRRSEVGVRLDSKRGKSCVRQDENTKRHAKCKTKPLDTLKKSPTFFLLRSSQKIFVIMPLREINNLAGLLAWSPIGSSDLRSVVAVGTKGEV